MSSILPINLDNLLLLQGVESSRVEFKASWNEQNTGYQVLRTICAFANDVQNLNGGYIIIGIAEEDGVAVLPPKGLNQGSIDSAQKWIRGNCKRIDPEYQPVMSPEIYQGQYILVLWVPASDHRPHKAPDGAKKNSTKYWIRLGSESVDANANGLLKQLIEMTARLPFDARRALQNRTSDLREAKVREFLRDVQSGLLEEQNTQNVYRNLKIAVQVNGYDVPLNVGLLMFSEDPDLFFPGARIEIVQFAGGVSGNIIEEKIFKGGLHEQIRACLNYLENFSTQHLEKQQTSARVRGWVSYPLPALREALVNALYHRSYNESEEPSKVYLYPDRMEIISYPGPVLGIEQKHLVLGASLPPVPARNRRIGEFLKSLKLAEGRGTGLPKVYRAMHENGSPEPQFDFDLNRTYFRVVLPAHPEYIAISALRDAAHLKVLGDSKAALFRLEESWLSNRSSATLAGALVDEYGSTGQLHKAEDVYKQFKENATSSFVPHVTNRLINAFLEAKRENEANKLLKELPTLLSANDAFDAAILARRLGNQQSAHRYFERAGDAILNDPRALHEFAQTKIDLARKLHKAKYQGGFYQKDSHHRLLREAQELLERVLQMDSDQRRYAWAWRDLARVKEWLKAPHSEVERAFQNAIELLPNETKFKQELQTFKQKWTHLNNDA